MKFSIGIPAYKTLYLDEAIRSIITQTYTNWELIILDDFSPFNIYEICSYYLHDHRIKYYKNEYNVGAINVVDNWNKCLNLASGDYFICMGDDDILCNNCLETYHKYILLYPQYNLFHASTEMIDEKSLFLNLQESRPLIESIYSMAWHRISRKREQFIGDFLFKTQTIKSMGGFYKLPLAWSSDDISAYLCAGEQGVVNVPDIIFKYRINKYTISNTGNILVKLEAIVKEREWYDKNLLMFKPINNLDKKYQTLIFTIIESCFKRKRISTIGCGMNKLSIKLLFNLIINKSKLGITINQIILGIILHLYNKYNN